MPEYYDVLGVHRNADEKTIRQAYRRLARKYHPDVNPGDSSAEDSFKNVNEAYSVLSNPEDRRQYDRFGDQWKNRPHYNENNFSNFNTHSGFTFDPRSMFGGSNHRSVFDFQEDTFAEKEPVIEPREHPIDITLQEAFSGTTRTLRLLNEKRIEAKIPPGVTNGSRIHIRGVDGSNDDFYLIVAISDHPTFRRENDDLYMRAYAYPDQLVLGGELSLSTFLGTVSLQMPPLTQNDHTFRIDGRGMPSLKDATTYGDLYVTISARFPDSPTLSEIEIYEQLRSIRTSQDG